MSPRYINMRKFSSLIANLFLLSMVPMSLITAGVPWTARYFLASLATAGYLVLFRFHQLHQELINHVLLGEDGNLVLLEDVKELKVTVPHITETGEGENFHVEVISASGDHFFLEFLLKLSHVNWIVVISLEKHQKLAEKGKDEGAGAEFLPSNFCNALLKNFQSGQNVHHDGHIFLSYCKQLELFLRHTHFQSCIDGLNIFLSLLCINLLVLV